jgi:hypothetical protein
MRNKAPRPGGSSNVGVYAVIGRPLEGDFLHTGEGPQSFKPASELKSR